MITGILIRYCRECNCAYPPADLICPGCAWERDLRDASELIEELGTAEQPDGQLVMADA